MYLERHRDGIQVNIRGCSPEVALACLCKHRPIVIEHSCGISIVLRGYGRLWAGVSYQKKCLLTMKKFKLPGTFNLKPRARQ